MTPMKAAGFIKPLVVVLILSIFLETYDEKYKIQKIFNNSEGCKLIKPNGNQRFAPLISRPTIITKIIKAHTTIKQCSEYFFQISVGVIAQSIPTNRAISTANTCFLVWYRESPYFTIDSITEAELMTIMPRQIKSKEATNRPLSKVGILPL